jgi:Holliday junction resolvasome RuvABC DNA-binding subunit
LSTAVVAKYTINDSTTKVPTKKLLSILSDLKISKFCQILCLQNYKTFFICQEVLKKYLKKINRELFAKSANAL